MKKSNKPNIHLVVIINQHITESSKEAITTSNEPDQLTDSTKLFPNIRRFSSFMQRHSWITGAIASVLLGGLLSLIFNLICG